MRRKKSQIAVEICPCCKGAKTIKTCTSYPTTIVNAKRAIDFLKQCLCSKYLDGLENYWQDKTAKIKFKKNCQILIKFTEELINNNKNTLLKGTEESKEPVEQRPKIEGGYQPYQNQLDTSKPPKGGSGVSQKI